MLSLPLFPGRPVRPPGLRRRRPLLRGHVLRRRRPRRLRGRGPRVRVLRRALVQGPADALQRRRHPHRAVRRPGRQGPAPRCQAALLLVDRHRFTERGKEEEKKIELRRAARLLPLEEISLMRCQDALSGK